MPIQMADHQVDIAVGGQGKRSSRESHGLPGSTRAVVRITPFCWYPPPYVTNAS